MNAIEGTPFESYAGPVLVDRPASAEAAAATAAHDVLVALFPAQTADLDAKYAASLAARPDNAAKVNGRAVGQRAASAILAVRAQDGRDATVTYVPGPGPGVWEPTPPAFLGAQAPEDAKYSYNFWRPVTAIRAGDSDGNRRPRPIRRG